MHFSGHSALLQAGNGIRVYEFDPSEGFEAFTMNVRRRIKAEGRDAFYVFDCLSDLQAAWATDLMMGNFFKVTCAGNILSPVFRKLHSYFWMYTPIVKASISIL